MDKKVDFTYPEGLKEVCNECLDFLPEEEREGMLMMIIDNLIAF